MKVQTCKFLINTLNETARQNNLSVVPKINSKYMSKLKKSDFNPYTAEIILNSALNSNSKILRPVVKKSIQHTTKHAEQFQIIARYIAGFSKNIDLGIEYFKNILLQKFPQYEPMQFNKKYYKKVIKQDGVIKPGHELFAKAKTYIDAFKKYPAYDKFENIKVFAEEGFETMIQNRIAKNKLKTNNLLETEAQKAAKNNNIG